jgi:hypothetical protein
VRHRFPDCLEVVPGPGLGEPDHHRVEKRQVREAVRDQEGRPVARHEHRRRRGRVAFRFGLKIVFSVKSDKNKIVFLNSKFFLFLK